MAQKITNGVGISIRNGSQGLGNGAKSLVFGFINTMTMECLDLIQFQRTMSVAYPQPAAQTEYEVGCTMCGVGIRKGMDSCSPM